MIGKHKLRVFGERVLKDTWGGEREETTGCWRTLHYVEHHNWYCSQNIIHVKIKKNVMGGECDKHGGKERVIQRFG